MVVCILISVVYGISLVVVNFWIFIVFYWNAFWHLFYIHDSL